MPKTTTFKHYDLNQAKRNTLNISAFGGVDLSSQKLQVASQRAIDLINFIYKDGVIQKRQGYTQKALVPTKKYIAYQDGGTAIRTNTSKKFNGIWHFLAEDGEYHTIAHIGEVLFEIKDLDEPIVKFELLTVGTAVGEDSNTYGTTYIHLDQKSMAFVGNNRLWFLGGNKYMIIGFRTDGRLIYEPVEESQYTFVPTTTTAIKYANAKGTEGRYAFDYANIMTMWRKNTCLSDTGKDDTEERRTKYYEYTLDGAIKTEKTVEDVAALAQSKELSSISIETQRALAQITIKVDELVKKED